MCQKMLFLAIFEFSGPRGQKRGPETKKSQLICHQDPKIYASPKFEGPTLKMKNFKILKIFENFLKNFESLNQKSGF